MDIHVEEQETEAVWVVKLNDIPIRFHTKHEADLFVSQLETRISALRDSTTVQFEETNEPA
ncbi:hypothetical protein IQ22_02160 [Pseudomonas duriflava]|uniref:Uncharacterized protein n=1 Tax=Pseudomonas duriflava TaxID=459528 RepID=A0A562QC12_9PSED|nr:hypothetical protein [Pseudomonas duriflava]TWI54297.1 hypothetical protein IQ22_02160 [Pseudomonas duriflava]